MKITLLTFSALAISVVAAGAQPLSSDSTAADPAKAASVLLTSRLGIGSEQLKLRNPPATRSATDTSRSHSRGRLANTFLGLGVGTLGGAVFGGVVGLVGYANADGDYMMPGTVFLTGFGAILGAVVGVIVGVTRPTN
jgi:hypothetical protein